MHRCTHMDRIQYLVLASFLPISRKPGSIAGYTQREKLFEISMSATYQKMIEIGEKIAFSTTSPDNLSLIYNLLSN